jgi:hypothetical protein
MKQQQQAEQVDQAQKLAVGAKTLAETPIGGTRTALQAITGAA